MKPVALFAPGAGASSSSEWMSAFSERLAPIFHSVVRFDYAYRLAGKSFPDRMPALIEAHQQALKGVRREHPRRDVFLIGKSMGSRVGCHLVTETRVSVKVRGLVCFGYPLVGVGKKRPRRDAVLRELRRPILFLQGDRDPLCPLDELRAVTAEMTAPTRTLELTGGDHSLRLRRMDERNRTAAEGRVVSQETEDARLVDAVQDFIRSVKDGSLAKTQ